MKEKSKEPEAEPEPEPTTEVLFLCSYEGCGKTFIDAGALRKHSHIHGERQYVCHYEGCGKVMFLSDLFCFVLLLTGLCKYWSFRFTDIRSPYGLPYEHKINIIFTTALILLFITYPSFLSNCDEEN